MTKKLLKSKGTFITENDHYDGSIYLYSTKFYLYENVLYACIEHSNQMRYTGNNDTFPVVDDVSSSIDRYGDLWWKLIGLDCDDLVVLRDAVRKER